MRSNSEPTSERDYEWPPVPGEYEWYRQQYMKYEDEDQPLPLEEDE